ncbi:glycosyltransferase family 2 protein [Rugamonas aquatica]|uniref:Glycosyltransferase n=1 Tax=Rugamonas aquatica TaxID=2743357 RepID=A0A6A7MZ26_9BURK|nr:glycosyltransferase family 2 protein [Rugamonas aquatica]MQA38005.1 glycosyltransferase [Rugamonas aquatica]
MLAKKVWSRCREPIRSLRDLGWRARADFRAARRGSDYQAAYELPEPLVTVCVATYNRGELLTSRCLKSLLAQDYRNLQIVVVGDCCTDDTAERVAALADPRIEFVNLTERGQYPTEPRKRWMVAGTVAVNHALSLARGQFITHLDDDDEHTPDRVSKLVALMKASRADIIWHPFDFERVPDDWQVNEAPHFAVNNVSTSSVFYHRWLRTVPWDINAWRYDEPGDWNRFRKIRFLGARTVRAPERLLKHYRERNQKA